jgi:hypothetical protein
MRIDETERFQAGGMVESGKDERAGLARGSVRKQMIAIIQRTHQGPNLDQV